MAIFIIKPELLKLTISIVTFNCAKFDPIGLKFCRDACTTQEDIIYKFNFIKYRPCVGISISVLRVLDVLRIYPAPMAVGLNNKI